MHLSHISLLALLALAQASPTKDTTGETTDEQPAVEELSDSYEKPPKQNENGVKGVWYGVRLSYPPTLYGQANQHAHLEV